MVALETAAAAKRYRKPHRKPISTSRTAALVLADPSLPNGVGIQGRGRSAMNGPMSSGSVGLCSGIAEREKQSQHLLLCTQSQIVRVNCCLETARSAAA